MQRLMLLPTANCPSYCQLHESATIIHGNNECYLLTTTCNSVRYTFVAVARIDIYARLLRLLWFRQPLRVLPCHGNYTHHDHRQYWVHWHDRHHSITPQGMFVPGVILRRRSGKSQPVLHTPAPSSVRTAWDGTVLRRNCTAPPASLQNAEAPP